MPRGQNTKGPRARKALTHTALGDLLTEYRVGAKLTLAQLAARVGVQPNRLNRLFVALRPNKELAERVAKVLAVPAERLSVALDAAPGKMRPRLTAQQRRGLAILLLDAEFLETLNNVGATAGRSAIVPGEPRAAP